jgi:mono/diheme cytochrome c family protein
MRAVASTLAAAVLGVLVVSPAGARTAKPRDGALVARGRYLVKIGGCNDCHTAGFAASDARIPEQNWLEGSRLGWHGPWGTTYAINLRLLVGRLTEKEWTGLLKTMKPKPPMPWWALESMTPRDRQAVYSFIRYLGPAGRETPADLPPSAAPPPPFVSFPMPPAAAKK